MGLVNGKRRADREDLWYYASGPDEMIASKSKPLFVWRRNKDIDRFDQHRKDETYEISAGWTKEPVKLTGEQMQDLTQFVQKIERIKGFGTQIIRGSNIHGELLRLGEDEYY